MRFNELSKRTREYVLYMICKTRESAQENCTHRVLFDDVIQSGFNPVDRKEVMNALCDFDTKMRSKTVSRSYRRHAREVRDVINDKWRVKLRDAAFTLGQTLGTSTAPNMSTHFAVSLSRGWLELHVPRWYVIESYDRRQITFRHSRDENAPIVRVTAHGRGRDSSVKIRAGYFQNGELCESKVLPKLLNKLIRDYKEVYRAK